MSVTFRFAARSDVGLIRKSNQDSGYAGPHLCVLADGMGGPAGGDIASSIAVAHLAGLDSDAHRADEMLSLLRTALNDSHNELVDRSSSAPELSGLGTTCIAMLRAGNKLAMVHIGDSRAYLLRDQVLTQVTSDHSFVQYLVDAGQITPEEAETHPQRSVLLRVLGDAPGEVSLDESVREAVVGDRWLLCSDGLHGVVSAETIGEVLAEVKDPDEACEKLVSLSLRAGAPDNVTCVVADVIDTDAPGVEPPETHPQIVGAAARDRLSPTKGSATAAGRAAALVARPDFDQPTAGDDEDDEPEKPRGRWLRRLAVLLVILAVIGGAIGGYIWSQSRYFVMIDSTAEQVCIYRGIHQHLGSFKLYQRQECDSRILVSKLGGALQLQLEKNPVVRPDLESAREYIEDVLLVRVKDKLREEEQERQRQADRDSKSEADKQKTAEEKQKQQENNDSAASDQSAPGHESGDSLPSAAPVSKQTGEFLNHARLQADSFYAQPPRRFRPDAHFFLPEKSCIKDKTVGGGSLTLPDPAPANRVLNEV